MASVLESLLHKVAGLQASVQFSTTKIQVITLESYSIFHYGVLFQEEQKCVPIIRAKERKRGKNLRPLTYQMPMLPSYRNQSFDLMCKSTNFLLSI